MNQVAKTTAPESDYGISVQGMPLGLAIMFNDRLYDRCKQIASVMARAEGFTPPHLIGKTEACFAVVTRAITWKLDPQAVAQSTYQTPGGRIGYEGKLVQAILENSGRLVANVDYELIGDWSKINGNFEIKRSEKGKDYAVPKWTRQDAKAGGCGVVVSAQVKGEAERRVLKFMLETCFPLNSTLWATRPDQQIKYTACRAFANTVAPGILMGEPFDIDQHATTMVEVNPRPRREDFTSAETIEEPAEQHAPAAADGEAEAESSQSGVFQDDASAEPSPADAYRMGEEARRANKPYRVPDEVAAQGEAFASAWQEGWNDRDAEIAKAKK